MLWHLTEVHGFWARVLADNVRTEAEMEAVERLKPERSAQKTTADILVLREQATAALVDQLARLADDEPRWSWWEPDQTVGFTRRMQICEATMHRVDAELTADVDVGPIEQDVATLAVDHCVDVMWGWMPEWADYQPQTVVEFVAIDTGRRWLLEVGHWTGTGPESGKPFDEPRAVRAGQGAEPAVTVSAPVEDLALWSWTRGGTVQTTGDPDGVAALERLIANGIQ